MNTEDVTVVRVYLTEKQGVKSVLRYLHDEAGVRGVTEFRGVAGFGRSGTVHSASLVDLSTDLPVVLEFFDAPGKVQSVVDTLCTMVEPEHILTWGARVRRNPAGEGG